MKKKQSTSHRLSDESRKLLALMAEELSISQTAILELAIREKAQRMKFSRHGLRTRQRHNDEKERHG